MASDPVDALRRALAETVRQLLAGDPGGIAIEPSTAADPGWFGPDSAAWHVHRDIATLVGGVEALLLQTLHPLAMAGVAEHSDFRNDALGRLHRTGAFLGRTVFGSSTEAESAIAEVRAIHERVIGRAPDGRPYRADDPHLLAWVHATEVDGFLRANQRYGRRRLSPADADLYVAEMGRVGIALGMSTAPRTRAELTATLEGYRPELAAGSQCREAVRFLALPPLPLAALPAYAVIFGGANALLPGWARRMLKLPLPPGADALMIRPSTTALLRSLGWVLGPSPRTAAEGSTTETSNRSRTER